MIKKNNNCPFCGGNELSIQYGSPDREGTPYNVVCDDCGACGPWVYITEGQIKDLDEVIRRTRWSERV